MSSTPSPDIHTLKIEESQAGIRLDHYLVQSLPNLSRSRLKSLIDQGYVIDSKGQACQASQKVKKDDLYFITIPETIAAVPQGQEIPLSVVFEDDSLIVIDKPAGLVVHPAAGHQDHTLVNALIHHCGDSLSGIGGVRRPGIVHRIDKDTSGLLVIAKTDISHHRLARQFAKHSIIRSYQAICWGIPLPRHGTVTGSIGRHSKDRTKMSLVREGGKKAITHYRVLENFNDRASRVECRLETGRTHQIRVHLTSLGHPLIGDSLYKKSNSRSNEDYLKKFPRQALHACELGFIHPLSQQSMSFTSPLPEDIEDLINYLRLPSSTKE
jgi:23S rRNA pseudouridine1911/1915/1917 synthase